MEEAVAAGKPFIGVSFNYRLQAFEFMSGTAVHKAGVANLALKDQRLALHWVQENIAAFGGNASEVTIWGESAGARSIGYQLIAYDGRNDGLFRSAVMQSGASAYWPKSFKNASAWDINYNSITDAANCSSAKDTLECLRHVPIDTLSAIFNSTAATSAMYAPSVDGDFLMDVGPKLIGEGKFVHVPILHGANCDEGTAFGKTGINTTEEFYEYLVGTMAYSDDEADVLLKMYPDIPQIGMAARAMTPATDTCTSGWRLMLATTTSTVLDDLCPRCGRATTCPCTATGSMLCPLVSRSFSARHTLRRLHSCFTTLKATAITRRWRQIRSSTSRTTSSSLLG